jgi:hypothetical protein
MKLLPKLHRMNYRPLWPDTKIVRVHGIVNDSRRITFWLLWVWDRAIPDPEESIQERGDWFTDLVLRFCTWLTR